MARRLIGLDVGTNAVTVADVTMSNPPRVNVFGQVALPRDAMREGEVVDEAAVSEAIARLRTEVGLKKGGVRVGIASPRVIVRQVEMPVMSKDDLASALRFQAPDLIPIPIDEAAMDFAVLGNDTPVDGEPTMRVLLAAAQEATVHRLVAAVERGGLSVDAVDLVPLALIRSLGASPSGTSHGAEGVVSFGGGVTAIAVHEGGVPRFVRVLGRGGRELTDAIASEVELPADTAEALKRQVGVPGDHLLTRARSAIDRPLAALVEDVRGSFDYYRNQPGSAPITRVVITGGGSQLPGIAERLSALLGVPVEVARPRDLLQIGDIGFADTDLPRLDPYLPAAEGLALGGAPGATVLNLLPTRRRGPASTSRSRTYVMSGAAAAALVAVLAVPTLAKQQSVSHAKHLTAEQQATNDGLQHQVNNLADQREEQDTLDRNKAQVQAVLATDVSWATLLNDVSQTIPNDVWLTSFNGSVAAPSAAAATTPVLPTSTTVAGSSNSSATTTSSTAPPGPPQTGTITFNADGLDFTSVTAWLQRMGQVKSLSQVFVPNAALVKGATRDTVQFTSTANITPAAHSDRVAHFEGGAQ